MAHPAAVVFALSLAVWVVDVRFAPAVPAPAVPTASACENGFSAAAPADADAEIVTCGTRIVQSAQ